MTIILNRSQNQPYVFIQSELPNVVISTIDKSTSYQVPNADYYNSWDGWVHLFKKTKRGDYYFPAGLLGKVEDIIHKFDLETEIIWNQQKPNPQCGFIWFGPELYEHQKVAIEEASRILDSGRGAILNLPTGSGKTVMALWLIVRLDVHTLIVVHTKELLRQWKENIQTLLSETAGVVGSGEEDWSEKITIGMIQTLSKKRRLSDFDCLVLDEAHHCPASTFYKLAMNCNAYYRLGLTATADRSDGAMPKFIGAIGEIIAPVTPAELIRIGRIARPEFKWIRTPAVNVTGSYAQAYKSGIVLNSSRNSLITKEAREAIGQVYIHVTQINHGKILETMIPGSKFIHASSHDREEVLEEFKENKLRILISTLLGEGVDIPEMNVLINAAGGKSEVALIQRIGRALRITADKRKATIVDFLDQGKYLRTHAQMRINTYQKVYG